MTPRTPEEDRDFCRRSVESMQEVLNRLNNIILDLDDSYTGCECCGTKRYHNYTQRQTKVALQGCVNKIERSMRELSRDE